MVHGLIVHLVLVLGMGWLADWLFGRWVRRRDVIALSAVWYGVALAVGRVAWLVWPLFNPLSPLRLDSRGGFRVAEWWFGCVLVVALGLAVIWAAARLWWAYKYFRQYEEEVPPMDLEEMCPGVEGEIGEVQGHLQREYRKFSGNQRLGLRFTWLSEVPVLGGFIFPTIALPVGFLDEDQEAHLEPILDHQAEHVRFGHQWIYAPLALLARVLPFLTPLVGRVGAAMVTRVDRRRWSQSRLVEWTRYKKAFMATVADRVEWSPALAMGNRADEMGDRMEQARTKARRVAYPWVIGGVFLIGFGGSMVLGRMSFHTIKEFLMHKEASGYQTRIFDPRVRVQGLVGKGGVVPDGIVVDTTESSDAFEVSSVQVRLRNELPKTDAVRVVFDWKATRTRPDQVDAPVATSRVTERVFDVAELRYRFRVFDFRSAFLKEGQGTARMEMHLKAEARTLPGAEDLLFGPDFAVPPGWRLELTHFRLDAIPADAVQASVFPEDAEAFVAWYLRHHQGTPMNLDW